MEKIRTFGELREFVISVVENVGSCYSDEAYVRYFQYLEKTIKEEENYPADNSRAASEIVIAKLLGKIELGSELGYFEEAGREVDLESLWLSMM